MPEPDNPAITVDRYGGIYSMTKVTLPWWHWRALLADLLHPVSTLRVLAIKARHPVVEWRAWRERRSSDFGAYLGDVMRDRIVGMAESQTGFFAIGDLMGAEPLLTEERLREVTAAMERAVFSSPRLDPARVPRSLLLRDDFAARLGAGLETTALRVPDRPAKGSLGEALAGVRATRARPLPTYACCGGPKALGHEPGCSVDIERRARSGRYDD